MKTRKTLKNLSIIIPILVIIIFSLLNMKNASLIKDSYKSYFIKQLLWISIGFIIIIISRFLKIKNIMKYSFYFYIIGNIFLLLLIIFGKEVNGTKAWFNLIFFNFQPSEFMKIFLLLYLSRYVSEYQINKKSDEFKLIIKVMLITIIPSILTFLEPDTGAVIIYFIIAFMILFFSKVRKRWFIYLLLLIIICGSIFFYLYFQKKNLFIKIFGTRFFYRMDRLIDFKSQNGLQLENALISIGSSGLFGSGINKVTLYFPEAPTDFIFAMTLSNFGLVGGTVVIANYLLLNLSIILSLNKVDNSCNYLYITGFLGMFIFQQFQNIFMNIGLMPIVGITLPFLSYGGSSTLIYVLSLALVIKMINDSYKEKII